MKNLRDYGKVIEPTDKLPKDSLQPVLMGLFGEVGSVMATAKKRHREDAAFAGYQRALEEEFGDVLWYFSALCRRLNFDVAELFLDAMRRSNCATSSLESDSLEDIPSLSLPVPKSHLLNAVLLDLGKSVTVLLDSSGPDEQAKDMLVAFADCYLQAIQAAHVSFSRIVCINASKACGRFLDPDLSSLPTFDSDFPDEERLPEYFEIKITQRKSGQCYLQWNDVFIGDPLTDNIMEPDGYRFHDVFHLAHAAVLHWAPTFRSLIKQKRKSDQKVDEAQDGGRAIVIEEGLSAWLYSRAKFLDFFEGHSSVSFDLLKTIQQFTQGYEVEKCPLRLWEQAILQGYEVFREVRKNGGGVVIGDRNTRTIKFRPLNEEL